MKKWAVAIPAAFLGYFFFYPLVTVLWTSLSGADTSIGDVLGNAGLRSVAWFTFWQAGLSTILTLAAALPAAYVVARYDFPGRGMFRAGVLVPFMLPTIVVAAAFVALWGPGGAVGFRIDNTVWAILVAHVFFNFAVVVRTVGTLWQHIDPRLEEAATMLGASRREAFRRVTLPLLRPAVAAAAAIVFLFSFTSFGIVLVLGGPTTATLEVEIYRQATALLNFEVAAVLAIVQLIGVVSILALYARFQDAAAHSLTLVPPRKPRPGPERRAVMVVVSASSAFLLAPLAVLVARSLQNSALGWRSLGGSTLTVSPISAVGNSLRFAAVATAIAMVVGLAAAATIAYRKTRSSRWFDALLMLPLGTSAVTLGFGFLVALDAPIDLRSWWMLVPIAHALVAIPFVVRLVAPVVRSIPPRLREAAAMLGASPAQIWRRVDVPIASPAALAAAGFAFAVSMGEFGATAFTARPDAPTVPVAIFRLLARPGAIPFGQAMALSVMLMVITAAIVGGLDRARFGQLGRF